MTQRKRAVNTENVDRTAGIRFLVVAVSHSSTGFSTSAVKSNGSFGRVRFQQRPIHGVLYCQDKPDEVKK